MKNHKESPDFRPGSPLTGCLAGLTFCLVAGHGFDGETWWRVMGFDLGPGLA